MMLLSLDKPLDLSPVIAESLGTALPMVPLYAGLPITAACISPATRLCNATGSRQA